MKVSSSNIEHLILRCDECGEVKELWTRDGQGGHSWAAANAIADEFDLVHDKCEEETR